MFMQRLINFQLIRRGQWPHQRPLRLFSMGMYVFDTTHTFFIKLSHLLFSHAKSSLSSVKQPTRDDCAMKAAPPFVFVLFLVCLQVSRGYILRINTKRSLRLQSSPSSLDRESPPSHVTPVPFTGTGCILLAQPQERDHFLIKGSLLVIEHGDRGSVGVLLDKSTPYSVKETSPGLDLFDQNMMFMGGGQGNDLAVMIHKHNFGGLTQPLGYGLYIGGIKQAEDAVRRMEHHPHDFKFIFNCVEWGPGVLEKEIEACRWDVCAMPPDLVLRQNPREHTPLWSIARNALTQHRGLHKAHTDDDDL